MYLDYNVMTFIWFEVFCVMVLFLYEYFGNLLFGYVFVMLC